MPAEVTINTSQFRDLMNDLDLLSRVFDEPANFFEDVIADELVEKQEEVFATDGYGIWPPRKDNLPHPLLRKSERMYDSLTNLSDSDNILIAQGETITFGTEVFYAIFHESDEIAQRIPQRSFLEIMLDHGLETDITRVAEDYLEQLLS